MRLSTKGPSLPHKPQVEIEDAGGVRQGGNDLAFHGDAVCVDFLVKGFAENDAVFQLPVGGTFQWVLTVEPELHAIEKMKALPVNDAIFFGLIFGTEENRGGEDALEALRKAAVDS